MRKSKFSPTQIAKILKEFEDGKSVLEITAHLNVFSSPAILIFLMKKEISVSRYYDLTFN